MSQIRNIGIFAHVDAGKTTLTEQILYKTGAVRRAGRVDEGTAFTDALPIERKRGISIRTQAACALYKGVEIRVIDTPGHVDFSSEVQSALCAIDAAVLVVSAVEGVQPQTAVIARVLTSMRLPILCFINKTDRAGADVARTLDALRGLVPEPFLLSEQADAVDLLTRYDEDLLKRALGEGVTDESIIEAAARLCGACAVTPAVAGAALKGEGVEEALDAIVACLPAPVCDDETSAVIYNISHEDSERRAHIRVFGGELDLRAAPELGRANRLRKLTPAGYATASSLKAGDIGVLSGLSGGKCGTWIGSPRRDAVKMTPPLMTARVSAVHAEVVTALSDALAMLADETPALNPRYEPKTREFRLDIMGEVHREVLEETLGVQCGIPVRFGRPSILYRETPVGTGSAILRMMKSPFHADIDLKVEPGAPGSGVAIVNNLSTDYFFERYKRETERALRYALMEGLSGWPVTDVVVTVTGGKCWPLSMPPSRFAPVVPIPLFEALTNAGCALLEPMTTFEIRTPAAYAGAVIADMMGMGAVIGDPVTLGGYVSISGEAPVRSSAEYPQRLRGATRGLGVMMAEFSRFAPCPPGVGESCPRTQPDPRDREAYENFLKDNRP